MLLKASSTPERVYMRNAANRNNRSKLLVKHAIGYHTAF